VREQVVESSRRKAWTFHACFTIGHLAVTRIQISNEWFRLFNFYKTMNKRFLTMMTAVMAVTMSFMFVSCGGDDDSGGSNNGLVGGWYFKSVSLDLSNLYVKGHTVDEHFYNDRYRDPSSGGSRGVPFIAVIHIIDDSHLVKYFSMSLYKKGAERVRNKAMLYQFTAGPLGTLAFYEQTNDVWYYSYTREGNIINVYLGKDDDGKDDYLKLSIMSDGLVESGSSKWIKYDPSILYHYDEGNQ
jgi:hypothetical protein